MIQALLLNKVIEIIMKKFKLDKVLKYVEEPNDADDRIGKLEIDMFKQKTWMKQLIQQVGELENGNNTKENE